MQSGLIQLSSADADIIPRAGKVFQARTKLFEQLIAYFPKDMREPKECLIDAVKFGQ